jgi:hypothetical protein
LEKAQASLAAQQAQLQAQKDALIQQQSALEQQQQQQQQLPESQAISTTPPAAQTQTSSATTTAATLSNLIPTTQMTAAQFDALEPQQQSRRLQELLIQGSVFQKFKHKRGKKRLIWCPQSLDRLIWGTEDKKTSKGFILIADIRGVTDGCIGTKLPHLAFTVVATQRTLELEAQSEQQKDLWIRGLSMLLYLSQDEEQQQQQNDNGAEQQQ